MKKLEVELTAISEAFEIAKEQGISHVVIRMPVPLNRVKVDPRQLMFMNDVMHEVKAAQILDKLRMRGTPIDMIDSYLLAGEVDAACIALRSVILENVYEHLQTHKHLHVQFSTKQNPHVHVPEDMRITVAEFLTGHCVQAMQYDLSDQNVQPPVYQIGSTQDTRDVGDALRATLLQQIANITTVLLEQIRTGLNTTEPMHIRLFPSWSVGTLNTIPAAGDYYLPIRSLGSHVTLGIAAYQLKKKELTT
jgi:hypothetical protein